MSVIRIPFREDGKTKIRRVSGRILHLRLGEEGWHPFHITDDGALRDYISGQSIANIDRTSVSERSATQAILDEIIEEIGYERMKVALRRALARFASRASEAGFCKRF